MKYKRYFKYLFIVFIVVMAGIVYSMNDVNVDHKDEFVISDTSYTSYVEESADKSGVLDETKDNTETTFEKLYVQICGEVVNPGVFSVSAGTRVYQIVEMAGGMTQEADIDVVNQAETVYDGQQIYIPAQGEEYSVSANGNVTETNEGENIAGKININIADRDSLMTLPGIGSSKAEAIIAYRESNGSYNTIEDIMNVSGIKQAAFDKIKDLICV